MDLEVEWESELGIVGLLAALANELGIVVLLEA